MLALSRELFQNRATGQMENQKVGKYADTDAREAKCD
jgi:hypothetical protein